MTIKIAHIADTHLGYKQYGLDEREKDFYDSFKMMIDDMIDRQVDYVIHCGDLFENPKPPIKALLVAQECFLKLIENGIDVYVIAGNHDILQRSNTSIPQELYENEHFHIISTKNNHYILKNDIYLGGLPYLSRNYESAIKKRLNILAEDAQGHKHKILMLHGGVSKYFDFNCEFELDTIPEGFDYYALGHIHQRILEYDFKNGIISYPGSTDIKDKAEIKEYKDHGKGYNLLIINEGIEVEQINFKLERKFIKKNIQYYKLDEKLDEIEEHIKNDILTKTDKKPVLMLNIIEGDFDRTEVSKYIYEKFEELALTVRLSYQPTETPGGPDGPDIKDDLNPIKVLEEEIIKEYSEIDEQLAKKIASLSVELYKNLSIQNLEGAIEISNSYFDENYVEEGDKDDNQ